MCIIFHSWKTILCERESSVINMRGGGGHMYAFYINVNSLRFVCSGILVLFWYILYLISKIIILNYYIIYCHVSGYDRWFSWRKWKVSDIFIIFLLFDLILDVKHADIRNIKSWNLECLKNYCSKYYYVILKAHTAINNAMGDIF